MKFSATLRGVAYSDPKEFAVEVKANPPVYSRGDIRVTLAGTRIECVGGEKIPMTPRPDEANGIKGFPIFKKPSIILTAAEREWLGATVRRSDGIEGQVWSLAHSKPGNPSALWLVAGGVAHRADLCELTLVESRVDQLALDV